MGALRRGFTLIELLIVIAIIGAMAGLGAYSLTSGENSSQKAGASRAVIAMIRQARSVAMILQKPVSVTYSNETLDGSPYVQVNVQGAKLVHSRAQETVYSLDGRVLVEASTEPEDTSFGTTLEEELSPEKIPFEATRGMRVKVLRNDEELERRASDDQRGSKISIFSTADNVSRMLTSSSKPATGQAAEAAPEASSEGAADEPVSVAFSANGMVDAPHRIWIYPDGQEPESGFCITVDRFGEITCDGGAR